MAAGGPLLNLSELRMRFEKAIDKKELFVSENINGASQRGVSIMPLGTILLIILVLLLIGALPNWGYSGGWGYGPSGVLGLVLVVVLVLVLLGRL